MPDKDNSLVEKNKDEPEIKSIDNDNYLSDFEVVREKLYATPRGVMGLAAVRAKELEIDLEGMKKVNILAYCTINEGEKRYFERADKSKEAISEAFSENTLIPTKTDGPYHGPSGSYENFETLSADYPELGDKIKELIGEQDIGTNFVFPVIAINDDLLKRLDKLKIPYHARTMEKGETMNLQLYVAKRHGFFSLKEGEDGVLALPVSFVD